MICESDVASIVFVNFCSASNVFESPVVLVYYSVILRLTWPVIAKLPSIV